MSPGEHGATGSQGSADPPEHYEDPHEMARRSTRREGTIPPTRDSRREAAGGADEPRREAKEPAPGDANPRSEPEGRPLDRRTRSL